VVGAAVDLKDVTATSRLTRAAVDLKDILERSALMLVSANGQEAAAQQLHLVVRGQRWMRKTMAVGRH